MYPELIKIHINTSGYESKEGRVAWEKMTNEQGEHLFGTGPQWSIIAVLKLVFVLEIFCFKANKSILIFFLKKQYLQITPKGFF